jgi:hypothetical protein
MNSLDRYARRGLWALPVYAALLLARTLTHQPDPYADFRAYAEYITTVPLVISHLVTSILGAGIGTLGLVALFVVLCGGSMERLALWALVTTVIGQALVISVFGVAAFAQPAIGHAFLTGQTAEAATINNTIYGPLLLTTALPGVLLLGVGFVLFGVAVTRSEWLPRTAGMLFTVSGPLFAMIGFTSEPVQTLSAALMTASTVWIARGGRGSATAAPSKLTSSSVLE